MAMTTPAAASAPGSIRRSLQRIQREADRVRQEWSPLEKRRRRLAADSMQWRLAATLGLAPAPARVAK